MFTTDFIPATSMRDAQDWESKADYLSQGFGNLLHWYHEESNEGWPKHGRTQYFTIK